MGGEVHRVDVVDIGPDQDLVRAGGVHGTEGGVEARRRARLRGVGGGLGLLGQDARDEEREQGGDAHHPRHKSLVAPPRGGLHAGHGYSSTTTGRPSSRTRASCVAASPTTR